MLLSFYQILVGVKGVNQFTVLCLQQSEGIVVDQFDLYSFGFSLFTVNLLFNYLQFFSTQRNLTVVHKQLLVRTSRTAVVTSQRYQLFLCYLYTGLLQDLSCCHSHEVPTLVNHTSGCLKQSLLHWHAILFNKQDFIVDQHEDANGMSSHKNIIGQSIPILRGESLHGDEPDVLSEHFHMQNFNLLHLHSRLKMVELLHIIIKLLALLDLGDNSGLDMREGEDWYFADLKRELKYFLHNQYKRYKGIQIGQNIKQ